MPQDVYSFVVCCKDPPQNCIETSSARLPLCTLECEGLKGRKRWGRGGRKDTFLFFGKGRHLAERTTNLERRASTCISVAHVY